MEGSSPQVRGIWDHARGSAALSGIIPAGAGHLSNSTEALREIGDHPRRCGAFPAWRGQIGCFKGSSPQVRGICLLNRDAGVGLGIIPAGAGHFVVLLAGQLRTGDHPRRCGAFGFIFRRDSFKHGSSPQVRGIFMRPLSR